MDFSEEMIAKMYSSMFDSERLIYKVINNDAFYSKLDLEEKREIVDRNVIHLELTVAREIWADEDMTSINSAIAAGNSYLSA